VGGESLDGVVRGNAKKDQLSITLEEFNERKATTPGNHKGELKIFRRVSKRETLKVRPEKKRCSKRPGQSGDCRWTRKIGEGGGRAEMGARVLKSVRGGGGGVLHWLH